MNLSLYTMPNYLHVYISELSSDFEDPEIPEYIANYFELLINVLHNNDATNAN
jgi:hypothetical protein